MKIEPTLCEKSKIPVVFPESEGNSCQTLFITGIVESEKKIAFTNI